MDQLLLPFFILILFNIETGYSITEYNVADYCDNVISMISADIKDALLYYEETHPLDTYVYGIQPCTAELWGWFEEGVAMHFRSFNTTQSTGTFVAIRQGDTWEEGRPIAGLPDELYGTSFDQLNRVYTSDWLGILVRVGGPRPPRGIRIFELALNVFHRGKCDKWEYNCDNGRCIDKDIKCSGYNPCGDESDCKSGGVSSGVVAVICVSVASVGGGVLSVVYYCVKDARKKRRRREVSESYGVTSTYARSDLPAGQYDAVTVTNQPDRDDSHNSRNTTPAVTIPRNPTDDDLFDMDFQNNYSRLQYGNHAPPSYNSVISSQDSSNRNDQRQSDNNRNLSDYDTALSWNDSSNTTGTSPAEQVTDVNSSAYLPSYSDVLQNEDAYGVTLDGGTPTVYEV